jgi:hypothetical protein
VINGTIDITASFTSPKIDVVVSFWIKVDQDNGAADKLN